MPKPENQVLCNCFVCFGVLCFFCVLFSSFLFVWGMGVCVCVMILPLQFLLMVVVGVWLRAVVCYDYYYISTLTMYSIFQ